MKKAAIISSLCFLLLTCILSDCLANNITVSAISLTNRNTATKTVRVNFDLSWDNSWRTTSAPFNWDAAWVFVKYRVGTTGEWKHATLATTGHTLPAIAASTQTDATGIFIYRSAAGGPSTFDPSGIQLQWNYGTDGVANEAQILVRVFAIEMVYNQVGGFQAGSGAISNGEFRRANDVTATAPASTFTITGTLPTIQGNSSSSSPTSIAAYNNTSTDLTGTNTASLAAGFPTGFNAFYSMKYEISQQQYVDFLNTLTYTQQAARTATAPNSTAGTGALINPNDKRNGIDIQTPGTASTVPAVYACNLNASNGYNDVDDGQHIACNYLSWDDLDAYLDWAGLRPMTELEFEKACRGNITPTSGEYPWGTATAVKPTNITNAGNASEIASNSTANIAFDISSIGPVRTGIFATGSSGRSGSGAGYYGNMDLGGNLWERVVTLGNNAGRAFSGNHGNGTLTSNGDADVVGWPDAAGTGWRGGAYDLPDSTAIASRRTLASNGSNSRFANAGGRGVKTISSGIVTDGLVLWLDAGVTASYPESGTTWTDLSGNRNNGTLINGISFNNNNGGSLSFDGVNDYASIENSLTLNFSTAVSISIWFNSGTNQNKALYLKGRTDVDNYNPYLRSNGYYAWTGINGRAQYLPPVDFIVNNTWYNLTVTHTSGSNPQIYKNGILATGYTYTEGNGTFALGTNGNPISINADIPRGTIETFNGRIAIIIAYPRSLSSAEVLQNFNAQKARFGL